MFHYLPNGTGREVEAHVARAPLLSLFRREEPVDGGDSEPYTLHTQLSIYVYAFHWRMMCSPSSGSKSTLI